MSEEFNDGGPAFPVADTVVEDKIYHGSYNEAGHPGMSLRDYFAAKAMQGELSSQTDESVWTRTDGLARRAYVIADAMLKARKS